MPPRAALSRPFSFQPSFSRSSLCASARRKVSASAAPMPRRPISPFMKPILLIEDEHALASALASVCRRLGAEVTMCASGRRGLDALAQESFGLVVLDIGLPDMSG